MHKITLLAIAMLALTACKPPEPSITVTDPNTGEKTKLSTKDKDGNQTITIDGGQGKGTVSISSDGAPPTNMPAFLPNYPGAKYKGTFSADMAGTGVEGAAKGGMATFTTTDSADQVISFYKNALSKTDMKETASGDMSGMRMLSFSKGDNSQEGAQIMVSAAPDGGQQVQVIYSTAP
jgi:predicted enzyme related to lactoylglutathione lyase